MPHNTPEKKYEYNKKYFSALKKKLIALGLCLGNCGRKAMVGKTKCVECLDKSKKYAKLRTDNLVQLGLCSMCGGEVPQEGKRHCGKCGEKQKERNDRMVQKREQQGLCKDCGKEKREINRRRCKLCLDYHNQNVTEVRLDRIKRNVCVSCGINKPVFKARRCEFCKVKHAISENKTYTEKFFLVRAKRFKQQYGVDRSFNQIEEELKNLWVAQNGICPLSGYILKQDSSSHIDHAKPRSFGGKHTADNLRWVYKDVNKARQNLSDTAFFKLCEDVVAYQKIIELRKA